MIAKVIIFGASIASINRCVRNLNFDNMEIVAFSDNDCMKWEKTIQLFDNVYPIISPNKILDFEFTYVLISTMTYADEINNQLSDKYKIAKEKILLVYDTKLHPIMFDLKKFGNSVHTDYLFRKCTWNKIHSTIKRFNEAVNESKDFYDFGGLKLSYRAIQSDFGVSILELMDKCQEQIHESIEWEIDEGLYEFSEVTIKNDDIVIDCGAYIGIFSALAATKATNGKVYAFEPIPKIRELLSETVQYYNNIEIVPCACSDQNTNAIMKLDYTNIGESKISTGQEEWQSNKCIEVVTTTLDEFVEKHRLDRVNFIKSDIEGFEKKIIKGAAKTIKKFSPKLSISTYHFEDDPMVLEKMIKDIDPAYVVVHKWQKLFAYVSKENKDKYKPIIIYGAGGGGVRAAKLLNDLDYPLRGFVDKDKNKQQKEFLFGLKVFDPTELPYIDGDIVLATVAEDVIENQLYKAGLGERIILKERYVMKYVEEHIQEINLEELGRPQKCKSLIIGSEEGLGNWGVEQYCRSIASLFISHNVPIKIITKNSGISIDDPLLPYLIINPYDEAKYWEIIKSEVKQIANIRPCIVQDNSQRSVLIAAILAKRLFPNEIKISSIIHNELPRSKKIVAMLHNEIDYIGAVNHNIIEILLKEYGIPRKKLVYKESPMVKPYFEKRFYQINKNMPVRIAFAARLSVEFKRVHLLVPLAKSLEKLNVNYVMDIAGMGSYYDTLVQEIEVNGLSERLVIHGLVQNSAMPKYWFDHDLYISLSESEGLGMTMLEAMNNGCVPIVSKIAAAEEYIEHGRNGYLFEKEDIQGMAEQIAWLAENRDQIPYIGSKAQQTISQKCDTEAYYHYFRSCYFEGE